MNLAVTARQIVRLRAALNMAIEWERWFLGCRPLAKDRNTARRNIKNFKELDHKLLMAQRPSPAGTSEEDH